MKEQVRALLSAPRHVSRRHPQMPLRERAAQFAPFAALSGYGEAIDEAAAAPLPEWDPDDDERQALEDTIRRLAAMPRARRHVEICTVQRKKDTGTRYMNISGCVRSIDETARTLTMEGNTIVSLDAIVSIQFTIVAENTPRPQAPKAVGGD